MLEARGLKYTYNQNLHLTFPDFRCERGEHWLLLGDSGSGKTTLLHMLAGIRTPKEGSIRVGEVELTRLRGSALDKFRGKHIGIVFQDPHFVRSLTVEQNLALVQNLANVPVDKKKIKELLERLRIGHKRTERTSALSQGEKQRVAIARALSNQPVVILADEPTSALDDTNAKEVMDLLEEQANEANATLVIVTHDNRLKERFNKRIEI